MGGASLPAMSNSGSGNQGIVATVPVMVVAELVALVVVLVPEQEAPESLVELWQKGEGCVCD